MKCLVCESEIEFTSFDGSFVFVPNHSTHIHRSTYAVGFRLCVFISFAKDEYNIKLNVK